MRKPSKKHFSTANNDLKNIIGVLNRIEPIPIKNESNISRVEEKALEDLKKLTKDSLEIKKADKSDVWVIMDKEEYCEKLKYVPKL